jgi:hypothetical protein
LVLNIVGYNHKYKADIQELVKEFYDASMHEFDTVLDMDTLSKTIEIYKDNIHLLIIEDHAVGIIAGLDVTSPINSDKVYQEIIWYVKKNYRRYGIQLLREVEKILSNAGYTSIIMACMHNSKYDKLCNLYSRIGYTAIETHFRRTLCKS